VNTVLVTGAAGFVGRHLCAALAERGWSVVGADVAAAPAASAPVRPLDICQAGEVGALVREVAPAAIVHLAAISSAAQSFASPERALEVNGRGTLNLLEAVRHHAPGARLLAVSSADIYGPCAPGERHDEGAPLNPVSPYGCAKAYADLLTGQYVASYDLDAVRVRPFSHTGPGHPPIFALPGFAHQIAAIEAGLSKPELRVGRLDVERDFSDVRDVVACYCDILVKSDRGAVLNVCRGSAERLDHLLEQLLALARVPIRVVTDESRLRPADLPRLVGDPSAIHAAVGWQAEITMERTLADLIEEARTIQGRA